MMRHRSSLRLLAIFSLQNACFSFHHRSFILSTMDEHRFKKYHDSTSVLRESKGGSTLPEQSLSNEEISRYSRHLVLSVSFSSSVFYLLRSSVETTTLTFLPYSFRAGRRHDGTKSSEELIRFSSRRGGSRVTLLIVRRIYIMLISVVSIPSSCLAQNCSNIFVLVIQIFGGCWSWPCWNCRR